MTYKSHCEICIRECEPGTNDKKENYNAIASWIRRKMSEAAPWHITRFFPAHRLGNAFLPRSPRAFLVFSRMKPSLFEDPENLGCMMAGNSQLYIDSLGNVQPCVFLSLSFGNILKDDLSEILSDMRSAIPRPLRTVCPSVILGNAIKSLRDRKGDIIVHYHELTEEFEAIAGRRANLWKSISELIFIKNYL